MVDLHDSHGKHIANLVNGQLHDTHGKNIGHFLEREGIFIDMHGRYLGEIVDKKRLLYRNNSPYRSMSFGVCRELWKLRKHRELFLWWVFRCDD